MRKLFTAMFAVFAMTFILSIQPSNAAVGNCNISQSGLTKDQHQILVLQCQAMKTGSTVHKKVTETTPEDIKEWAGVAKGFAEALGVAAKEMGIAVNDFLGSPAGVLTAILIMWKVMGNVFVGMFMLMFSVFFGLKLFRMSCREQVLTDDGKPVYDKDDKPVFILKPVFDKNACSDERTNAAAVIVIIAMFISMIVSFIIMA